MVWLEWRRRLGNHAIPWILRVVATASLGSLAPHAWAGHQEPVCRVPSVIDVMAREVRQRDHYARIEPRLIAEYPGSLPNIVVCGVWARTLRFDTRRYGDLPLAYNEWYQFQVQALLDGYVVKLLR